MTDQEITVTAMWTAKPGRAAELKGTWEAVADEVNTNEPGVSRLECYEVQGSDALIIHEAFRDGAALGAHLGGPAHARHISP